MNLLCPCLILRGHYALMAVVCLSIFLSVPWITLSRERKGIGSWNSAWRKPITWVTRDPIYSSKGQRSRPPGRLTTWPKISHIVETGEGLRTSNLYTDGVWSPSSPTCAVNSKLKALGGCSGHHLQGREHIVSAHYRPHSLLCPAPRVGGIKRWCASHVCLSDVCLSVAYIGPKSRTERPRKTQIGTEVAHVTRDSDTIFKVKRWKVNLQGVGAYCGDLPHSLLFPCP